MTATLWNKALALAIGTTLGSAVFVVASPIDLVELWKQKQVEQVQKRAELHRERLLASASEDSAAWCGSHRHTNGYESHALDLYPGGFSYEASGCMGTAEIAYGKVARPTSGRGADRSPSRGSPTSPRSSGSTCPIEDASAGRFGVQAHSPRSSATTSL